MVAILIAFACIYLILFTVGFAVGFCRLARTYKGIKDKHLKNVRNVLPLMCFLLISVLLNIPAIVFVPVMDIIMSLKICLSKVCISRTYVFQYTPLFTILFPYTHAIQKMPCFPIFTRRPRASRAPAGTWS